MARVLLFGAAWMVLLASVGLGLSGFRRRAGHDGPVAPASVHVRARTPPPRAGARYPGWTVIRATSAHHTMVVEVEAERVTDAGQIAAQIVEPLKDRYEEVLVYIRTPAQPAEDLPARRVQWTSRGGYAETIFRATF